MMHTYRMSKKLGEVERMKRKIVTMEQKPLLYIDQPTLSPVPFKMQDKFYAKDEPIKKKEFTQQGHKKKRKEGFLIEERPREYDEIKIEIENKEKLESLEKKSNQFEMNEKETKERKENEKKNTEVKMENKEDDRPLLFSNPIFSFQPLKSFKDMTIEERLKYLASFPKNSAPFPCEFITNTKRYKGNLISYDDQHVNISTFSGKEISILKSDLQYIRIIGLL